MFSKYLEVSTITLWLLLCREISAVLCKKNVKRVGLLCSWNKKKFLVKSGGTNKYHLRFQGLIELRNHINIFNLYPEVSKHIYVSACSRIKLYRLTVARLTKKFSIFYRRRWLMTMFAGPYPDQFLSPVHIHPVGLKCISVLSFHLRLGHPSDLFP